MDPIKSNPADATPSPSQDSVPSGDLAGASETTAESPAAAAAASTEPVIPLGSELLGTIQSLAITIVIAVFVVTFVLQAFQIPSESMENTLLIGDYLLVDKVHFAESTGLGGLLPYTPIRRGDIIVFRPPQQPQMHFVKRVIALPGDRVRMRHKQVFINDLPLHEDYTIFRDPASNSYRDNFPRLDYLDSNLDSQWLVQMRTLVHDGELVVPAGNYFVLGDNRDQSLDSRYWGFVPRENIIGRPLVIYWSLRHRDRLGPTSDTASDKLLSFAYTVTHLYQETRWDRAFRRIQ